jgi:Putative esterase
VRLRLDPAQGGTVKLTLTKQVPPETLPPDTETIKYIKFESKLLSRFHGRPMFLRAGVVLPRGWDREPQRRYPLVVGIGGYGSRYTAARGWERRLRNANEPMLVLQLDGAGPYGDPYQVNSANNGPYGDAVTQELIPYVEAKYRGIGQPYARFTTGASTGGWVSLALQVFYPAAGRSPRTRWTSAPTNSSTFIRIRTRT